MNVNSGRLHIILIMQFAIVSLQVSESKLNKVNTYNVFVSIRCN
ncbi:hypothetical protein T07_1099 [Trichinella nelsoni]|uniref:Uncharacterized protein n=1 Tax=Trichinella nelsoni TaxID=6336 RepID=A0A0V0RBP0_9BILA|nr:hypothetical protein T07_1099 [Trichinella nelsoni]